MKGLGAVFIAFGLAASGAGCALGWDQTLPASTSLGSPRGYRIARTIVHLHSPYSNDACDSHGGGEAGGTFNEACYQDLRTALCKNRVDFALVTDHPDNMSIHTFSELALTRSGDTVLTSGGTVGSQITCSGSTQTPQIYIGFEKGDGLMATLMTQHEATEKLANYENVTAGAVTNLKSGASSDAVVLMPHSEKFSDTTISGLDVHGFEIYNLHANLSPSYRSYLGLDTFGSTLDLLAYWIDPYGELQPDLAFLSVFEWSSVYVTLWNKLITWGGGPTRPLVTAGSDAHENVIASSARDGERVDSYRRLLRWFSNHFLVSTMDRAGIKAAMLARRGWIVFEALGSPVNFDFTATVGASTYGVGESQSWASGAKLNVALPTLHSSSPQEGLSPRMTLYLKKMSLTGTETTVASAVGQSISYTVPAAGVFRAEVWITPHHLLGFLGYLRNRLIKDYPWIVTNAIYLN